MENVLEFDPSSGRLLLAPEAVAAGRAFATCKEDLSKALANADTLTGPAYDELRHQVCLEFCAAAPAARMKGCDV